MKLIIDARLSEPPSEISVFRDITLYSKVFLKYDVLLECEQEMRDIYWYWLKKRGAFDFISDIIRHNEEHGLTIRQSHGNITLTYLRVEHLREIINRLKRG